MRKITIAIFATLLFVACSKQEETKSELPNDEILSMESESDADIASRIVQNFGGTIVQSNNDNYPQFDNYDSAAKYINSFNDSLEKYFDESLRIAPPDIGGGTNPCNSIGTHYANLFGTAGIFSNFRISFYYNGVGISTATISVNGVSIGWTWSQTGHTFNGSSLSGCVEGTLNWSVGIGSLSVNWTQNYYISVHWDAANCLMYYRGGYGSCP